MFKNWRYWSNNRWALIYGACMMLFGLQIYCLEVDKAVEVKVEKSIHDSENSLYSNTLNLMWEEWGTHITIEKAKTAADSTQIVIDRVEYQRLVANSHKLAGLVKMGKVQVHPVGGSVLGTPVQPVKGY
jgi:hypothetical protein